MSLNKNEANKRLIEKINQVEKDYNKNFSNTQKILLTTDGSITAILDVLFGKIDLTTLEQHTETASAKQAELIKCVKCIYCNRSSFHSLKIYWFWTYYVF